MFGNWSGPYTELQEWGLMHIQSYVCNKTKRGKDKSIPPWDALGTQLCHRGEPKMATLQVKSFQGEEREEEDTREARVPLLLEDGVDEEESGKLTHLNPAAEAITAKLKNLHHSFSILSSFWLLCFICGTVASGLYPLVVGQTSIP